MRNFSKKLAFVLAAAMVFTAFAPAAKADAAEKMVMNRASQTLYVNEGVNDKGAETLPEGLYGNVQEYDFYVKNKPANYAKEYNFLWESSNEKVATVDQKGLTKAVGVGTATITCTITDKATKVDPIVTTAKVTVKANAADVVITNAEDYEDFVVADERVIDLNRAMYDEDGNKTTKRGTYVTDYTKWVAEFDGEAVDAAVVAIDQATGKFTFAEDAPAGEYELYCQTYQSEKYTQVTAESEKVVVTVEEATKEFAVKQDSTTQVTVLFDKPVESLGVADVSVIRLFGSYEYAQQVRSVVLAKDGLSAAVSVFNSFQNNVNYIIKVADYEDVNMTASVGRPVRMEILARDKNPSFLLTTGVASELVCKFYDAKDVDVTPTVTENVSFRLEKLATNGDYYLAGKSLTIKKNTAAPVVIAEYPGWFENGKRVGNFSHSQQFVAEDAAPVVPVAVSDFSVITNQFWGDNKTMQKSQTDKQLWVKVQRSNNAWDDAAYSNNDSIAMGTNGTITFTALNPDVAVVNSDGKLTAFKAGTASFYVNFRSYNNNTKNYEEIPFDVVHIEVKNDSYVNRVGVSSNSVTIGTADGFCTDTIKFIAYDQYEAAYGITTDSATYTVECLSDGFTNKNAFGQILTAALANGLQNWTWGANCIDININAQTLKAALTAEEALDPGEAITLYFKITYRTPWATLSDEFAVTLQEPSDPRDNYVQIMASDAYKDVLRVEDDNMNGEKTIKYDVFFMNNGVKVQNFNFESYPASGAAVATPNNYYFKIFKDGQDFYGQVDFDENTNSVIVHPSKVTPLSGRVTNVVSGGTVGYEGAGTYTFALFKCYEENGVKTLLQEYASEIVVAVGDAGQYYIAGDQRANFVTNVADTDNGSYSADDAAKILKCFTINDRKGNGLLDYAGNIRTDLKFDKYYVDYTAASGTAYVYVKEITFFETVGTNEYVAYTVAIDKALDRRTAQ